MEWYLLVLVGLGPWSLSSVADPPGTVCPCL